MITSTGITLKVVVKAGLLAMAKSAWHTEPGLDGRYCWHASSLAKCPRELILQRAFGRIDPQTEKSILVTNLGTMWHKEFETWLQAYQAANPGMEIITQEIGYRHSEMHLAAKPDALIRVNGKYILIDFKTEHENATARRRSEAKAAGRTTDAKPEHAMQLAATALCLEDAGFQIDEGRIWYMSKAQAWYSEAPVDTSDIDLRTDTMRTVAYLDACWRKYEATGELPAKLADGSWQCRAVKDSHCGEYCAVRSKCFGY